MKGCIRFFLGLLAIGFVIFVFAKAASDFNPDPVVCESVSWTIGKNGDLRYNAGRGFAFFDTDATPISIQGCEESIALVLVRLDNGEEAMIEANAFDVYEEEPPFIEAEPVGYPTLVPK